jgi:hypothetical protein
MSEMKGKLDVAIKDTWSDYSDLDYWITEMESRSDRIPKWVLKMAMKHLRKDLYAVHRLMVELRDRMEDNE